MAFIFVPGPDGSFTEGDKQVNPDTGVEYIYTSGAWRALGPKIEDEFDTLDDRYIKLEGTTITGDSYRLRGPNATGDAVATYHSISNGSQKLYHIETPEDENINWVANVEYVQQKIDEIPDVDLSGYLPLTGGTMTGTLVSNVRGNQRIDFRTNGESNNCDISRNGTWQFSIQDGKTKVATDIDMTNHQIYHVSNLKIDHGTGNTAEKKLHITGETADGTGKDLFWSYKNVDGTLDAVNYNGKMTTDSNLVNKKYVDDKVASSGGVPVGSIMIWMNSSAPAGWFKLQGGSFDINTYPQLHAYLQGTAGYTSGRLPNWSGHYPGEYGDHMATALGTKVAARTGRPEGGAPRSSNSIPNGTTRTFAATGNTNAYSAGASKVTIDENWDNTTRPKTVVVHYIIKHD